MLLDIVGVQKAVLDAKGELREREEEESRSVCVLFGSASSAPRQPADVSKQDI